MGLFSKRLVTPLEYPAVARTVHVAASAGDVIAHLGSYSQLWSPKRAEEHVVTVGQVGGWTGIQLPEQVHPWQLHNLAFWMLDCPGCPEQNAVVAESSAGPDHPAYRLGRDPELDDALCGWDDDGIGWTVVVPGNDIVRGEDVPVSRSMTIPSGYQGWLPVPVRFEDPGKGMNERNESNAKSRRSLRDRSIVMY